MAECLVMSFPSKKIEPFPGGRSPETTSKRVVFPAPLGPISPRTSPRLHFQGDVAEGDDAGEGHAYSLHLQAGP